MLNTWIFNDFSRLRRSLERSLPTFPAPYDAAYADHERRGPFRPPIEAGWTSEALNLRCILPGVKAEDLELSVQGSQLTVRGERKAPEGFGDAAYYRLGYGKFERAIDLPETLDGDSLEAHLHEGVLDVRIPVKEEMKPRRIEVAAGEPQKVLSA